MQSDISFCSPLSCCVSSSSSSSSSHGGRLRLKNPTLKKSCMLTWMEIYVASHLRLFYSDKLCLLLAQRSTWDKAPSAVQHVEVPSRRWCSGQSVAGVQRWPTLLSTTQEPPLVHLAVSILYLYVSRQSLWGGLRGIAYITWYNPNNSKSHLCFSSGQDIRLDFWGHICHLIVSRGVKNVIYIWSLSREQIQTVRERGVIIRQLL